MKTKQTISILGSTGSIGTNTVDVIMSKKNNYNELQYFQKDESNNVDRVWILCSYLVYGENCRKSLVNQTMCFANLISKNNYIFSQQISINEFNIEI